MNSDGTNARSVTSAGTAFTSYPTWAPDGHSLLCNMDGVGAAILDTGGTSIVPVPGVNGQDGKWSPDGAKLVFSWTEEGVVDGEAGIWRQLRLANPDGSDSQVLVEQFVKDSDVWAHIASHSFQPPDFDWFHNIRSLVGPLMPKWAPTGDAIAFLAALPFDPDGPAYHYQEEVWLYDLDTAALTRLTNDLNAEISLSWMGDNTYPDYQQITVNNVTVTFAEVVSPGLTTILWDDDPPAVPTGHRLDYEFHDVNTTADVVGPVTIHIGYSDADVGGALAESQLALLHYNEGLQAWEDITTSRDSVANVVSGLTESLSPIALQGVRRTQFPDVPAWGYGPEGLDPYWAYYHVMACAGAAVVSGYGDGSYRPTQVVTRDQMAVYVARALANGDDNVCVPTGVMSPSFTDVPADHWAYRHVEYCVGADIVQGYPDGSYRPNEVVNRGQMTVYIARAAAGGDEAVPDDTDGATFIDVTEANEWAWCYRYVEYCGANGIVQGYADNTYRPASAVTRDQMAVYVARAFELPM